LPPLRPDIVERGARLLRRLCLAGLTASALGASSPAWSQSDIADLNCPDAVLQPQKPITTPVIASSFGDEMPPLDDLGALAHPVIREQPLLDPAKIPGFSLSDGKTPKHFAFFGDSHIAAGPMMGQLAQAIRARGETVAMGYLPPTMGRANVKLPIRAYCIGRDWSTELAYTAPEIVRVGPAMANRMVSAGAQSYLWLDLRNADRQATVRKLDMIYRPSGEGTEIDYSIDDGAEQHAMLPAASTGLAQSEAFEIAGSAPISTLKLRVSQGRLILHGFILSYADPPQVTFDVFGIPGSTARGWVMADPAYMAQTLHGLDYDAIALEYGTNEGNDPHFDRATYASDLATTLSNMRIVFPHASCLLIGPPDRGVLFARGGRRQGPDILKYARIHQQIGAVQAEVGAQFGCAAWSWQDLMGGPGGSYGWALATPRTMGRDLTHLTGAGYRLTANALAKSLGWADSPPTP
jgi:hypothetical protein